MDALSSWLRRLGLDRYASVLAEHEVDLEALRLLTEKDLQELGLPLGPRAPSAGKVLGAAHCHQPCEAVARAG